MQKTTSILVLVLFIFTSACSLRTKRSLKTMPPVGSDQSQVEVVDVPQSEASEAVKIPKVGLILGPGGVRSFAYTGIIKELEKANIPIDSIIGIEWGALVGALYAQNGKIHEAEWKLFKLEKEVPGRSFLTKKLSATPIKEFDNFFSKNFGSMKFSAMNKEFACPSLSLRNGRRVWQENGSLSRAVERCLPFPPTTRPKVHWIASGFSVKAAIEKLKSQGVEVVIFVNVLGSGELFLQNDISGQYEAAILWQELRRKLNEDKALATEVIEVQANRYKLFDFKERRSIVVLGERAGRKAAPKIARKYGF